MWNFQTYFLRTTLLYATLTIILSFLKDCSITMNQTNYEIYSKLSANTQLKMKAA